MSELSAAPVVYEFIKDCLPERDLKILTDAMKNRAAWNYGTSEFAISQMDKHYRKLAKKILKGIDGFTERNGPVSFSEEAVE